MSREMRPAIEALVQHIEREDWTTLVEVKRVLSSQGVPVDGDLAIELRPNTFLWGGMSPEFVEVVHALQADMRVTVTSASPLAYLIDGGYPLYPLAKRVRDQGYKEPHWLPIYYRPFGRSA